MLQKEKLKTMEKETLKLNAYKFDKILPDMQKKFGKIPDGSEADYNYELCSLEVHILEQHLKQNLTDREVIEALKIVLLKVDERLNNKEYEYKHLIEKHSEEMAQILLKLIDPFENPALIKSFSDKYDFDKKEDLEQFYSLSVRCVLKIQKTVERWGKWKGTNGYLNFLNDQIHPILPKIDEYQFYSNLNK